MDDELVHPPFAAGQVVTVFRSRLAPEAHERGYVPLAVHLAELARQMPGFIDVASFSAPDGERVTIATFADRVSHEAWRTHPEHLAAQARGVAELYESFTTQVCDTVRASAHPRP